MMSGLTSDSGRFDLLVERPAAGGRMLGRHDGVVVLVAGAIPGERVRVQIERRNKNLIWARVVDVLEASASRRPTATDPACGGADYLHIAYPAQCTFKSDIVVDAFRRIGKLEIAPPAVDPSPESGYRVRARLHVVNGRVGFFLEGTHTLCDAAATRQLSDGAVDAAHRLMERLGAGGEHATGVVICENAKATERVLDLEPDVTTVAVDIAGLNITGVTVTAGRASVRVLAGTATVTDRAADLLGEDSPLSPDTAWTRHAASFFQGNRYVTGALLRHVLATVQGDRVLDLYSGVGLFAVACAAQGRATTAVEGDRASGQDLDRNAAPYQARLRVSRASVEEALPALTGTAFDTVIVDPPRTGLSNEALAGLVAIHAPAIVYVSCDPATLARDAARLVAAGYRLVSTRCFDLFPNTAHVETVASFMQAGH